MDRVNRLDVFYNGNKVGTLAYYKPYQIAFEYTDLWIAEGFSISPLSLPLEKRVFIGKPDPFDGLFGVFNDSLPDGWGRLVTDRLLLKNHINPKEITALDRLALVGKAGMGALEYKPASVIFGNDIDLSLDDISKECNKILKDEDSDNLDYLCKAGGSPGGARPKILKEIDGEDWLIKFPAREDSKDTGYNEYRYALCARDCGVEMSDVKLFESQNTKGYFGTKRFDRVVEKDVKRSIHVISVSGLLETSHRVPNLDYNTLMRLTLKLTHDMEECKKLYKLMCFNVFSHNRDDHSKNFSYIYSEKNKSYELSPAYDLTYSSSLNGEHATMVNGNGTNPGVEDVVLVAKSIGIKESWAKTVAEDIRDKCKALLEFR